MIWTPQQEDALDAARRWMDDPWAPQVFRLFGYAGTGKTTIARSLWEHAAGRALSAAFTGKAASVMSSKGLSGATTVHRLIYNPAGEDGAAKVEELRDELRVLEKIAEPGRYEVQRANAVRRQLEELRLKGSRPKFILKDISAVSTAPLVILDEVSMVDFRMAEDLLSFGTKVLALGDPAQLPPVRGTGYFTDAEPDALLTEVHRQAADSPILRLATDVRMGRALRRGDYGAARVVASVGASEAVAADQVLCGTNAKRRTINARHRQLAGHESRFPEVGEKLVCLRNNHDRGLLNGTQWLSTAAAEECDYDETAVDIHIQGDAGGDKMTVSADARLFMDDGEKQPFGSGLEQFTWGSCLTVHKAQGSQWGSVVLFDDWSNAASHRQWLYTGVTRAAEKVVVVVA